MTARSATPSDRARQIYIEGKGQVSLRDIMEQLVQEGFPRVTLACIRKWKQRAKWNSNLSPAILAELTMMRTPRDVPEPDLVELNGLTLDSVQTRVLAMAYGISETVLLNIQHVRPRRVSDVVSLAAAVTQLTAAHAAVTKAQAEMAGVRAKDITPGSDDFDDDDRFANVLGVFSGGKK